MLKVMTMKCIHLAWVVQACPLGRRGSGGESQTPAIRFVFRLLRRARSIVAHLDGSAERQRGKERMTQYDGVS